MSYTVGQLKRDIEDLPDEMEVRMAQQPRWAFEYSVRGVVTAREAFDYNPNYDEDEPEEFDEADDCLYIVEGSQLDYLRYRDVWEAVR